MIDTSRSRPESAPTQSWFGTIQRLTDPEFAPYRPRGKVRGGRRYYRALERDASRFTVKVEPPYDYMHWHADWPGRGNLSWRARRAHLKAIFTMFQRLLDVTTPLEQPYQCWIHIDAWDSSQDAVYVHTPNPSTTYPNPFVDVQWDCPVPERLQEFITTPSWQFGRSDVRWTRFFVRPF